MVQTSTLLLSLCLIPLSASISQFKGGFDPDDVDAVDTNGQTFKGHIESKSHIEGTYSGRKGSGPVSVDSQAAPGNHQNLDATWNGKKQTADVDKGKHEAVLKDSKGDTVEVDGKNSRNIPVTIKGTKGDRKVHVARPSDNEAIAIDDATGKKFAATGLRQGTNVDVGDSMGHNYNSRYVKEGKDISTQLKAKVVGNIGPSYTANEYRDNPNQQEGALKTGFNPLDSGSPNPFSALAPSATVTADKVRTQSCPEGKYGDAFGRKGFEIIDKSISAEVDPISVSGGVKTYAFPSCFIMKASVRIPPEVNIEDVAGQLTAYISPVGNLDCEADKECPDKTTQGRPQGNCFYCNFCNGGQSKSGAVFGSQTDVSSNLCTAKSGSVLPLQWKVCPPSSARKYDVFQKDLLGIFKTDMDATIRIFVKSSAPANKCSLFGSLTGCKSSDKAWTLMGCRQAIISYSVSGPATRGKTLGSHVRTPGPTAN